MRTPVSGTDEMLGSESVTYPAAASDPVRGLELDTSDQIHWGEDGRSLHFDMRAQDSVDQMRVLVQP